MAGNRLLLTGALFRVAKDNARTPGLLPTDPPQVLAGRQVSQGLELSASGAITSSLTSLGSLYADRRANPEFEHASGGRKVFPEHAAKLRQHLDDLYGAAVYGRGRTSIHGPPFGNNTNTRKVDCYATLDTMVSYRVNQHLDLRLNLSNLNNEYYFERLGGGHLVPGPSRYVLFTTNFHF